MPENGQNHGSMLAKIDIVFQSHWQFNRTLLRLSQLGQEMATKTHDSGEHGTKYSQTLEKTGQKPGRTKFHIHLGR